jgi:hypothetical protein
MMKWKRRYGTAGLPAICKINRSFSGYHDQSPFIELSHDEYYEK